MYITIVVADDQTTNRSSVDLNAGETLDNALKCQHCFHFYSDPRVLPCFHTFCRQCIDVDETGDTITCPLCRKEFPSAEDGIDRLPLNVFVDKLMDVIKMISYANKLNICGLCGSKSESEAVDVKFADKYCIECKQLLCNSCWEGHRNSEATQEHRFCEVRDKSESVGRMMALLEPWCQDHDKKSFEFYCYDCCSVLCRTCLNEKHKTHKCNEIEKVENEFSQDISSYVEKLDRDIDKCSEDVSKLGSIEERLNDEISKVEEEILERAAMMTSVVDEDEEKLLQEIKTSNKARTKKMDDVIRKLSHKAMLAELMKKYIEELKTKGTAVDVAREVGSLQKATDFILKSDSGRQLNDAEHVNTTFTAANLLKYSSHAMENAVGKVELEWTRKGEMVLFTIMIVQFRFVVCR